MHRPTQAHLTMVSQSASTSECSAIYVSIIRIKKSDRSGDIPFRVDPARPLPDKTSPTQEGGSRRMWNVSPRSGGPPEANWKLGVPAFAESQNCTHRRSHGRPRGHREDPGTGSRFRDRWFVVRSRASRELPGDELLRRGHRGLSPARHGRDCRLPVASRRCDPRSR